MSEESKSIWKKPMNGWRGFGLWFIALFFAAFLVFFGIGYISEKNNPLPDSLKFSLICGFFTALLITSMVAFGRWVLCWRNFRRFLFGLACGATLIALFYAEEDWRGWHDWQHYKQEQVAGGEKFDFKDYFPATVPDEQNFALTPVVASSYAAMLDKTGHEIRPRNTNVVDRTQVPLAHDYSDWPTNGPGSWEKATLTDLKPWQDYYRTLALTTNLFPVAPQPQTPGADVLLALSKYDATVEEIREAAKLPYSRFPIEYDKDNPAEILLPHLAAMKRCSQLLQLRAQAELQEGQAEKAFADIQLNYRLTEAIHTEPFVISQLVRFAMLAINLQPVYEGLARHQWTDAQLVGLDAELGKLDCLADYSLTITAEPAAHTKLIDYLEQKRDRGPKFFGILDSYDDSSRPIDLNSFPFVTAFYLAPKGWFYQNEIRLVQQNHKWNVPMVDAAQHTVSPKIVAEAKTMLSDIPRTPYYFFARLLLPSLGGYAERSAFAQSSADLARTAVALERYRLAHGEYPDSLDALAPQFIAAVPHDVIGGAPLKYRRTSDGLFVLYSIGWNETDDGGVIFIPPHGSRPRHEEGDWVWRYPGK